MARRATESMSLSFLDIMCCGFGAIILLLVITRTSTIQPLEQSEVPAEGAVKELQEQLFAIRGETTVLNRELNAKHEQLSRYDERIARLRQELSEVRGRYDELNNLSAEDDTVRGELALARQSLTEEMRRLQAQLAEQVKTDSVGGIPVDSEYVIFIIDTSGSMFNYSWNRMLEVMEETLDVYPSLKGIQVMNDEGDYMFSSTRGDWIPDTPARRKAILDRLRTWNPFSNSSPVEGVVTAIRTYYQPDRKISLYVLGDDFMQGASIRDVIDTVDRINSAGEDGNRLVRIHAIGFPVYFVNGETRQMSVHRFATLMRLLTERNGGTFVALSDAY
ncbi:MAG: hypothetical protein ACO3PV_03060 [Pseudohongiellaceae bacterium]